MTDIKKLEKEETTEITGGSGFIYHYNYVPGDRKSGPCKYCGAVDSLVFNRATHGWENGNEIICNVFRCEKCGEDSYFSMYDDHLLM